MTNLYMTIKPYGKEHFSVSFWEDNECGVVFYVNKNFIIPSPLPPEDECEDVDGAGFWCRVAQGLDLSKLRTLGRRLIRQRKALYHIPIMRSCSRKG